jgi:hypothetical protein
MIDRLKSEVETKYGRRIENSKDCRNLAILISEDTGDILSETTVRRCFGLLRASSKPSLETLNILSQYIGYNDWEDYKVNLNIKDQIEDYSIWDKAYKRARNISKETISSIQAIAGINLVDFAPRQFADSKLNKFVDSDYIATGFVAPGGSGKTVILTQWADNHIKKNKDDIVLFLKTSTITAQIPKELHIMDWISKVLGSNFGENLFNYLYSNPKNIRGRLIIIIDGLDEISFHKTRFEKLFFEIIQMVSQMGNTKWFKLVVSSRNSTWDNCASMIINAGKVISDKWFGVNLQHNIDDKTNVPPLTRKEIQKFFDSTINRESVDRLKVSELDQTLKETISHPYFLKLYTSIYNPQTVGMINSSLDLLLEFMKSQIYFSEFADEKVDILLAIAEITNYGINGTSAKKRDIKNMYPINLKHGGNYFAAYDEMLSFGIITEEMRENRFNTFTKYVYISHQNLFEILVVNQLIEDNNGIDFDLFKDLEMYYEDNEILPSLFSLLYQRAYKDSDIDTLEKFFTLSKGSLDNNIIANTVGRCLRHNRKMRNALIPVYARQKRARKFYFEKFIDLNFLLKSYDVQMKEYAKYAEDGEEIIFAESMLIQAEILSLNIQEVKQRIKRLNSVTLEIGYSPFSIARWLSANLIYNYMTNKDSSLLLSRLSEYKDMANEYVADASLYHSPDFEFFLYPSLLLCNHFRELEELISNSPVNITSIKNKELPNRYVQSYIYKIVCDFNNGKEPTKDDLDFLDSVPDTLSSTDGYINILNAYILLIKYSGMHSKSSISSVDTYFSEAMSIIAICGFDLYELLLLDAYIKALRNKDREPKLSTLKRFEKLKLKSELTKIWC